ncbi:MAG: carboxymuconolactone decarboxylase family protein [Lachnospiraceae bacterium]|nr:carboxymuconolactone decarboxylase family protein [Lachnospiraceae bacterium]MDD3616826.1 carboxymuconolactone decarboxylase family protein [Lachnospiraceae bacterium]
MTQQAKDLYEKMFLNKDVFLQETDPEYSEIITNFAFDEVPSHGSLDENTRMMAILAALMGCQGIDMFREIVRGALNLGLEPVKIREVVYQGNAYLGIGRAYPFLKAMNDAFKDHGIKLPLEAQATVNADTRLAAGNQKQIDYFGEGMRESWAKGAEEQRHIQKWLADNCFGDYYTRNGLSDREREMVTFCYIMAQGGCEPQLTAHAMGNMGLGNDKQFLIEVVSQCVPYIGYPRSLNALSCVNKAAEQMGK